MLFICLIAAMLKKRWNDRKIGMMAQEHDDMMSKRHDDRAHRRWFTSKHIVMMSPSSYSLLLKISTFVELFNFDTDVHYWFLKCESARRQFLNEEDASRGLLFFLNSISMSQCQNSGSPSPYLGDEGPRQRRDRGHQHRHQGQRQGETDRDLGLVWQHYHPGAPKRQSIYYLTLFN